MQTLRPRADASVALCQTATDIGTKAATREAEERLTLAAQWTVGAVLLSLLCLVWYPSLLLQPAATFAALTRPGFWLLLLLDGVLNVIAYYLFVGAFWLSDASLVAPLVLITPVLLLVTSPLILGEHVPPLGALGVIFAVLGSAFLGGSDPSVSRTGSWCAFDVRHSGYLEHHVESRQARCVRLHTTPLGRNANDLHCPVQYHLVARYAASPAASARYALRGAADG